MKNNLIPDIIVGLTDKFDAQVRGMLMAKYSRTLGSIRKRVAELFDPIALKESFKRFFVGYGHKSVGQLGFTDSYFEGVSQLAAKALENNRLYNGQESSTRYIPFDKQPMVHFDIKDIEYWQEKFRDFYLRSLEATIDMVRKQFPFESHGLGYDKETWERTTKARAFDICRGTLPAGVTTNVGWVGNFDVLTDHFGEMVYHPSPELSDIASKFLSNLQDVYPYAVDVEKTIKRYSYIENDSDYFYNNDEFYNLDDTDIKSSLEMVSTKDEVNEHFCQYLVSYLVDRSIYQKIPQLLSSRFTYLAKSYIDFGSYRDLHRHRNGFINMPLLTPNYGFHDFYLDNIEPSFKSELNTLLTDFQLWYNQAKLTIDPVLLQYAVPMGFKVPISYKCDFNQIVYIFERRSGKDVHQTARIVVQEWYKDFLKDLLNHTSNFVDKETLSSAFTVDMDEENFTMKRGTQTFTGM